MPLVTDFQPMTNPFEEVVSVGTIDLEIAPPAPQEPTGRLLNRRREKTAGSSPKLARPSPGACQIHKNVHSLRRSMAMIPPVRMRAAMASQVAGSGTADSSFAKLPLMIWYPVPRKLLASSPL